MSAPSLTTRNPDPHCRWFLTGDGADSLKPTNQRATAPAGHFDAKGKGPSKYTLDVLERSRATLPFSDTRDFVQQGGIIGLRENRERIAFDISLANARRANLRISSKLLSLANVVDGRPEVAP